MEGTKAFSLLFFKKQNATATCGIKTVTGMGKRESQSEARSDSD